MINSEKDFINTINEKILKPYDIKLTNIAEEQPNVLAFFSPITKEISINKCNDLIFNDYIYFISTMQHENVHLLNDKDGKMDVYMDGKIQVHNQVFKDRMYEEYGFKVTDVYGGVDFSDKDNHEIFKELVIERINNKEIFNELQEYYLNNIYKYRKSNKVSEQPNPQNKNGNKENKKNGKGTDPKEPKAKEYIFEEEDGIAF